MLLPNEKIGESDLKQLVQEQFRESLTSDEAKMEFVPLGEDSWCYRLDSLWISVRRDRQGHVAAAYDVAHELRQAGLEFILAPLAGQDGQVVHTVKGLPVVVFPFVNAKPLAAAMPVTPQEAEEIISMISKVHEACASTELLTEDYRFPFAEELTESVAAAVKADADCGPYSQRLHQLIVRQRDYIRSLETEAEQVACFCARTETRPVLTHGEPSAGNVLRSESGLLLADWGGVMWGPPERDWYHVRRSLGLAIECRPQFLRFYKLRWVLGEISEYTTHFGAEHAGDEDSDAMWGRLLRYLPDVPEVKRSSLRA